MAISPRILVADSARHARALICDILRSAGYRDISQAVCDADLRELVDQQRPAIVIMSANLPGLSGLSFAKQIRNGHNFVPRETSIILTTDAPTRSFLEEARAVGVDEVVAIPFTTQTLTARIRSVVERPRPFVDCPTYVGPCRRRVMLQDYKGPLRRAEDPAKASVSGPLWSAESNRSAVRLCVQKISEYRKHLEPERYTKLREIYQSVTQLETRSDQDGDAELGEAAKSFGRYISGLTPGAVPAADLLNEHIDAIHVLVFGKEMVQPDRLALVASLQANVQAHISRSVSHG